MHVDHRIPFGIGHVFKGSIAQNARVVDENIQPAKVIHRTLNHGLSRIIVSHRPIGGRRLSAGCSNFFDHRVCHAIAAASAVSGTAQIVYYYASAMLSQ